jgi:hypothetical protein
VQSGQNDYSLVIQPDARGYHGWHVRRVGPIKDWTMKILVIEDEPKTGEYLRKGLAESSFVVDLARTGADGLHHAMEATTT